MHEQHSSSVINCTGSMHEFWWQGNSRQNFVLSTYIFLLYKNVSEQFIRVIENSTNQNHYKLTIFASLSGASVPRIRLKSGIQYTHHFSVSSLVWTVFFSNYDLFLELSFSRKLGENSRILKTYSCHKPRCGILVGFQVKSCFLGLALK